jgi:competence protein ComEA
VLFSSRRPDDADVIRARLRAVLAEGPGRRGWLPGEEMDGEGLDGEGLDGEGLDGEERDGPHREPGHPRARPWEDEQDEDDWTLDPDDADEPAHRHDPHDPDDDGDGGDRSRAGERVGGRHRASGPSTRVDPGPHGARTLWVVALLAAVAVAGWSWATRPEVSPVGAAAGAVTSAGAPSSTSTGSAAVPAASTGQPAASSGAQPQQIVVAVVGQVASPGLVTLPAGARVADALAAAGGLLPEADPASVNAAAVLADGQQVAVGVPGAGAAPGGAAPAGSAEAGSGGLLDLNRAGLADLDALPGIGPVLAQRILDHRTEHGPFTSVDQLDDVSGIGPSLFADIAPLVTV